MTNSFARAKFLPKLGRWGERSYNLVFRIGQGFYNTILKNIRKLGGFVDQKDNRGPPPPAPPPPEFCKKQQFENGLT